MTVQEIVEALSELYSPEGVHIWMHSRHEMLNYERPIDAIHAGDTERVGEIVEMLVTGAF